MPLFEYTCTGCQSDFELLVRGSETPACPECGGQHLEKHFSVPAAHVQSGALPMREAPSGGNCGRPQCGMGGCMGL